MSTCVHPKISGGLVTGVHVASVYYCSCTFVANLLEELYPA